jgi:GT2 family glycosyltransferase
VNIGAAAATGSHLLVLNPDIEFHSNPFPRLLAELRQDDLIGAIAPLLNGTDGNPQILDFYPTLPTLRQFLFFRSLLGRIPAVRAYALRHFHSRIGSSGIFFVEQIPGAFLLFRRELIGNGPVLNEAYLIWMEDVDFCLRLKQRGLKAAVVADERVTHIGGFSFQSWSESHRMWMFNNSYLTYLELNMGLFGYFAHTTVMLVNALALVIITPFCHIKRGRKFTAMLLRERLRIPQLILRRAGSRLRGRPEG